MLNRPRRAGPLAVDPLPALVEEQGRVTRACMQLGEIVGDDRHVGVVPRTGPDSVARVRRLIAIGWIPLDAEVARHVREP